MDPSTKPNFFTVTPSGNTITAGIPVAEENYYAPGRTSEHGFFPNPKLTDKPRIENSLALGGCVHGTGTSRGAGYFYCLVRGLAPEVAEHAGHYAVLYRPTVLRRRAPETLGPYFMLGGQGSLNAIAEWAKDMVQHPVSRIRAIAKRSAVA